MDYQKIYWDIINRAIDSKVEGYTEKHHAYPACLCRYSKRYGEREEYLFDRDADDLIVELTAREHYVAHQLLAKIYPTEPGLQLAAHMMTVSDSVQVRNNRLYEWVRRRHAKAMSESQSGKSNSQYGRRFKWMYHPYDLRKAQVPLDQVDKFLKAGYEFGLKPKSELYKRIPKSGKIGVSAANIVMGFKKHIPGYARLEVAGTQNIKHLLTPIYENLTS